MITHLLSSLVVAIVGHPGFRWALAVSVATLASLAAAQPAPLEIPHRVTCAECRVEFERILMLGNSDNDLIAPQSSLWRDAKGNYFAMEFGARSLLVWDSTGKRTSTLGRSGGGPGEFGANIRAVSIGANDSVLVLDGTRRLSVFAPNHRYARMIEIPGQGIVFDLLPNGRILVGTIVNTPQHIGQPYHIFNPTGRIESSFGGEKTQIRPGVPIARDASLYTMSHDRKTIWHWSTTEYRLEQWGLEGKYYQALDLTKSPWFRAAPAAETSAPNTKARTQALLGSLRSNSSAPDPGPQPSNIFLVRTDELGRLWFVATNPISTDAKDKRPMLEIVDPVRREKIVSTRVDHHIRFFPNTDLAYSWETEQATGIKRMTVWRVNLRTLR